MYISYNQVLSFEAIYLPDLLENDGLRLTLATLHQIWQEMIAGIAIEE